MPRSYQQVEAPLKGDEQLARHMLVQLSPSVHVVGLSETKVLECNKSEKNSAACMCCTEIVCWPSCSAYGQTMEAIGIREGLNLRHKLQIIRVGREFYVTRIAGDDNIVCEKCKGNMGGRCTTTDIAESSLEDDDSCYSPVDGGRKGSTSSYFSKKYMNFEGFLPNVFNRLTSRRDDNSSRTPSTRSNSLKRFDDLTATTTADDGTDNDFFCTTFYLRVGREYMEVPFTEFPLRSDYTSTLSLQDLTAEMKGLSSYVRISPNALLKVGPSPQTMMGGDDYMSAYPAAEYPSFILKEVKVSPPPTSLAINKDYEVFYDVLLGKGGNGEVYLGIHRSTGLVCAIKREGKTMLYSEYNFLLRARHMNSVSPLGYYPLQDKYDFLILEFLPGGTVRHLLKTRYTQGLPIHIVQAYFYQVILALSRMHAVGLVHRDLKTANLMLSETFPQGHVKIVDLGNGHQMSHKNTRIGTNMTTCFACAPEIIEWVYGNAEGYTEKVDIWAAGTVLYEMITGKRLFDRNKLEDIKPLVEKFLPLNLPYMVPKSTPPLAVHLLQLLLTKAPSQRISASEALNHSFFRVL